MSSAVKQAVNRRSSVTRPASPTHTSSLAQLQVGNENPNAHHANKAQGIRAGRKPWGNVSTQTRLDTCWLWRCDGAGYGRAYEKLAQLINY